MQCSLFYGLLNVYTFLTHRVQYRLQSSKGCVIKRLKKTKLYSIAFLRAEMTSDPSNNHREYSPYGSYSLFKFEHSDIVSVLENSIEYSFAFFSPIRLGYFGKI